MDQTVQVKLTAAGVKQAGGGTLQFSTGHADYTFTAGKSTAVQLHHWQHAMAIERQGDSALFELAPAAATDTATSGASQPTEADTSHGV